MLTRCSVAGACDAMTSRPAAKHRMSIVNDANIARTLWEAADQAGERPAVMERGHSITYKELRARAGAVARQLLSLGTHPGDRIAILIERGVSAIAAYFGILAAGGVAVIVNERLRPRQIEHVLAHSSAAILLSTEAMLRSQPRPIASSTRIVAVETTHHGSDHGPVLRIASDYAQIIFTSGSTGLAKGVTFTHDNLRRGAATVVAYLGLSEDDRIASLLPLSSVYGLNQLLCATASRATLVVERSTLASQIARTVRDEAVTVLAAVPPLWLQLLHTRAFVEAPLPALRIAQNAGGHLPLGAVRELRGAHPAARLFLQYGLTETFRSTFLSPDEVDRHPDSIGRAVPGAEILVVREDLTPCDTGEVGEIVHRGPTVAAGYWNDAEATERVFRPNPLRPPEGPSTERVVFSGDLARRDADGLLYFVGRNDRMIKTLGHRVAPDEVSDVLLQSGEVLEAVVAGEPDATRGARVVAYVVLASTGSLANLQCFCRQELPRHMQPCRYEVRDRLPRLNGGKYDLGALQDATLA
jgi:acyl-CoA synthetase (AMP-forming)/AMP-acid ligase II